MSGLDPYDEDDAEEAPGRRFVASADHGKNLFLTGMAGTGKTTILRNWMSGLKGWKPDVTASTGIAALNIGGMTIHRWCGMRIGPAKGEEFWKYLSRCFVGRVTQARVRECRTLVIDEISMLSGRLFDYLNYHLKRLRCCDDPFGGVQLIVIGDFLQLPPVRTSKAEPYDWVFKSQAWEEAEFQVVSLTKNWRQITDGDFISALCNVRNGRMDERLMKRVLSNPPGDMPRIMTHNLAVDKWNNVKLAEIENELWVNQSLRCYQDDQETPEQRSELDAVEKGMLTPQRLELKVGALVMFTTNNQENDTVNGELGYVRRVPSDGGKLIVEVERRGRIREVEVNRWAFRFNYDIELPCILQYPLRLAYAMTIHKSQGLTMDNAYVDIRAAREPGQAYVALSRMRTIEGLRLKEWPKGIVVSREAKQFYER